MKPHASIFAAALRLVGVAPGEATMVGDSVKQDVNGALAAGLKAILLHRGESVPDGAQDLRAGGVPIIRSLRELPSVLEVDPSHD
jgi:putative hydrolase of the HAD superfamily